MIWSRFWSKNYKVLKIKCKVEKSVYLKYVVAENQRNLVWIVPLGCPTKTQQRFCSAQHNFISSVKCKG